MDPITVTIGLLALLFGGGAIFVLLWNKYRDKISEWAASRDLSTYGLDRAIVVLDRWVTRITAKVKVRRKERYYEEEVYEETLNEEQIEALKNSHPDWFARLEEGRKIEVDILKQVQ